MPILRMNESITAKENRRPLIRNINNNADLLPANKKQRIFENKPLAVKQSNDALQTQRNTTAKETATTAFDASEILLKQWLVLPVSQYGIKYDLGAAMTAINPPPLTAMDGFSILQMAAMTSPFQLCMQGLNSLLRSTYSKGAGLVYVREIFEEGDPEYKPELLTKPVDVTTITKNQVDRLRLMVIDEKRRQIMVSYLSYYELLPYESSWQAVDQFDAFKCKYAKVRNCKDRFNRIFCFTFALKKFPAWMHRMERACGRQKMVDGLALRWKNLLINRLPEELGLDSEFSYPAVITLLQDFKTKVESAPTFGDPQMVFKYE
jgi:hypothetical protein